MKRILLCLSVSMFALTCLAQTNPKLTVVPKNITVADTVAIKIKALQEQNQKQAEENAKLQQELDELKASINALKTTLTFVSNNLNALQTSYNTFTQKTYPGHWHPLNGTAGNILDENNHVVAILTSPASGYMTEQQKKIATAGVKESLRKTGPPQNPQ